MSTKKNCLVFIIFSFLYMKVFLLLSIKRYRCYVTKRNMICKVAVFWVYQKYLKTACNWTCQKNWQALLGASLAVKPRMSFNKIKMQKLKRMFCMQIHFIQGEDEFGNFCTSPLDGQYRKRRKTFFPFPFQNFLIIKLSFA